MAEQKEFHQFISAVISRQGVACLASPSGFRDALLQAGCDRTNALLTELCLDSCPSIAEAFMKNKGLSYEEFNRLAAGLMGATGLTGDAARGFLTELARGCGWKHDFYPIAEEKWKKNFNGKVLASYMEEKNFYSSIAMDQEKAKLSNLIQSYENGYDEEGNLSALDQMARNGNPRASYYVGYLYLSKYKGVPGSREKAQTYLEFAADMGYGPAYAALASLEVWDKKGSMEKASTLLSHPLAFEGHDGKNWMDLTRAVFMYRKNNQVNARQILPVALISLLMALFLCRSVLVLGVIACVFSAAGVGSAVLTMTKKPFFSQEKTLYLLDGAWAAMLISLFFVG